jgi:hypothetical protein
MSTIWNNILMLPASELIATMDGTNKFIGTLLYNPVKLVLDNQSSVGAVLYISMDGGTTLIQWKTFVAAEAIIIDSDVYTPPIGTQFYANGAAGNFSISYFYAKLAG